MKDTESLRKLMKLDAGMNTSDIETRFREIAEQLFRHFAIQQGEIIYLFKEIEFYFYNQHHCDIIAHPRESEPLRWYVNDFGGIDLNFASRIEYDKASKKFILDDNAFFGGILLRKLISEDGSEELNGPWACAELFRWHDAIGSDPAFPKLVEHDNGEVGFIKNKRSKLLPGSNTVESVKKKVDYILSLYKEHPAKEGFYQDFTTFFDKPYQYMRCDTLMHDRETTEVYFSLWLKDKIEGFPIIYKQLTDLLTGIGVTVKELRATKDYWARDYMPIQLGRNEFLRYRYYPDYLVKSKDPEDKKTISDVSKVLRDMGIPCRTTKLIIDGGNMVPCGQYIVMTDKVFTENGRDKGDADFKALLESELGHPVIIIPWTMDGDFYAEDTDKYGHADGFIKWCGGNRVLMGNHGDKYPAEAAAIRKELESYGFEVVEMRFNGRVSSPCTDLNWAYINFLQVGRNIIMPIFRIEEDEIARQFIQEAFPDCTIYQIEMTDIARKGGALHCISWNILPPDL